MMNRTLAFALAVMISGLCAACGGGGGSDDPSPCSVLKIAGGQGCGSPPNALVIVSLDSGGYCSGTFITTRQVLTAAHCAYGESGLSVEGPNFGARVQRAVIHPRFNPSAPSDEFDVAVLTINGTAPVSPVPLEGSVAVTAGEQVVAYGFGLDQDDDGWYQRYLNGEDVLKATYLDVPAVSNYSLNTISDGSGDTCAGDSGGPLLFPNAAGTYGIVGLTRYGPSNCVEYQDVQSENTNVQNPEVLSFILRSAPGTQVE